MADEQKEQHSERVIADPKLSVSALFAASGEVAPVDFARFGKCVGEIIARAARPRHKPHTATGG